MLIPIILRMLYYRIFCFCQEQKEDRFGGLLFVFLTEALETFAPIF